MTKQEEVSFEKAFERLESILDILNSKHPSLEDSLSLYEEADKLIGLCSKKLVQAEKKIEMLMKNREGMIQMGQNGAPLTTELPE